MNDEEIMQPYYPGPGYISISRLILTQHEENKDNDQFTDHIRAIPALNDNPYPHTGAIPD